MTMQAKVVERLRGCHIPYKGFFQSNFVLWHGKERRVVSVAAFEGFPRVRTFLLMFTLALADSSWKGTLLTLAQGLSLCTHRGTSDGHFDPPPWHLHLIHIRLFGKKDHFTLEKIFACFLQLSRRQRIIVKKWFRGSLLGLRPPFFVGLLGAGNGKWQDCRKCVSIRVSLLCWRRHLAILWHFWAIKEHNYHVIL